MLLIYIVCSVVLSPGWSVNLQEHTKEESWPMYWTGFGQKETSAFFVEIVTLWFITSLTH